MRILKTLKPGKRGTRELLSRYGPSLLCVRYRCDEQTRERLKTVELIVQRRSPHRRAPRIAAALRPRRRCRPRRLPLDMEVLNA